MNIQNEHESIGTPLTLESPIKLETEDSQHEKIEPITQDQMTPEDGKSISLQENKNQEALQQPNDEVKFPPTEAEKSAQENLKNQTNRDSQIQIPQQENLVASESLTQNNHAESTHEESKTLNETKLIEVPDSYAQYNQNQVAMTQTTKTQELAQDLKTHDTHQSPEKKTKVNKMMISPSPWESFLIQTITSIRYTQSKIQNYSNIIFSRQGIPLLIIMFGFLLLSMVILFAYNSFKQEQTSKINKLVKRNQPDENSNKPMPLSMAYAEEESGDFDIFQTNEGTPIKLDLAQAYINMQDIEGAKSILNDIIHQHRGKIVNMAQEMLRKISS